MRLGPEEGPRSEPHVVAVGMHLGRARRRHQLRRAAGQMHPHANCMWLAARVILCTQPHRPHLRQPGAVLRQQRQQLATRRRILRAVEHHRCAYEVDEPAQLSHSVDNLLVLFFASLMAMHSPPKTTEQIVLLFRSPHCPPPQLTSLSFRTCGCPMRGPHRQPHRSHTHESVVPLHGLDGEEAVAQRDAHRNGPLRTARWERDKGEGEKREGRSGEAEKCSAQVREGRREDADTCVGVWQVHCQCVRCDRARPVSSAHWGSRMRCAVVR